ncbi:MAG: hypothetical protein CMH22_06355 [Methylophaga sp.]|nr:hypothetical protein [Methylophaga sp.]|tara:strand:- start:17113 stop:17430 length:318 start_codon:yes stop_codon:yes gene_type:complete
MKSKTIIWTLIGVLVILTATYFIKKHWYSQTEFTRKELVKVEEDVDSLQIANDSIQDTLKISEKTLKELEEEKNSLIRDIEILRQQKSFLQKVPGKSDIKKIKFN